MAHDVVPIEQFQDLTRQMLDAARLGDWDALVDAESARTALMAAWQSGAAQVAGLDPASIEAIMVADAQVLHLVQDRRQEIGRQLGEFRLGQRMNQAYRDIAG